MELRSFPEAIKSIMYQRGWTQSTLAREWGRHQTWVSRTMRGERDTPIGEATRLLASVGYEVVIRPKREKSDPVKRREFHGKIVQLAGGTVAQKVAGVSFVPSAGMSAFRNHEYISALGDHVYKLRGEQGGAWLIPTVRGYLKHINFADVLGGNDRRLQIATARLVNVHALTFYDADRPGPAEEIANKALALARASLDSEARAHMYVTLSQVATYAGAGDRGRYYAEEGLRISDISDGTRAELANRLMRSLAILPGQGKATLKAFDDIQRFDEELPGVSLNHGVALSDLGKHRAAVQAFSSARTGDYLVQSSPHYYAQCLHREVISLLRGDMPEAAADRILMLVHILPFVNSARLHKQIGEIFAESNRWVNVSGMRDAREQLRAVATIGLK
jgi:transcriptional regulator with XRE-family HTH domain